MLKIEPSDGNQGPHITDVYGENGEYLKGDLIKDDHDSKIIEMKLNLDLKSKN